MGQGKERLDVLLVERGLVSSRERAKSLIMAGNVLVNEQKIDKAGTQVPLTANIRILGQDMPFVSRGGFKLAKAVQYFHLDLKDKIAMDVGASTGGFTDCMLQHGAKKVYAIDVGYGQLAWKLRSDERVVNMERTNIRHVAPEMLPEKPTFVSIDVAFISLTKVLPTVITLLAEQYEIVALIKPQFEAGKERVGKKGVVRDPKVHIDVIAGVANFCRELSLAPRDLTYSPVKGPEGNIEYLIYLTPQGEDGVTVEEIEATVKEAHETLRG